MKGDSLKKILKNSLQLICLSYVKRVDNMQAELEGQVEHQMLCWLKLHLNKKKRQLIKEAQHLNVMEQVDLVKEN